MVAKSNPVKACMVNSELLNKAVEALLKHHDESDSKTALLGNDLPVQVQFTLARVPGKTSSRPIRIQIPHPLHKVVENADEKKSEASNQDGLEEVEVCLIVKDESKEWVKELIEKFPSHTSCIKKVLTLTSLRKKYTRYKDRRELLKRYDLFMADDRILPMLGKALGKNFFQEKKQPIPLKLTRKEALPFAIQRCLRSSYMWISPGTCVSVKAGNTAMPSEYLVANAEAIVENAVGHFPKKWANVSAVSVKTAESVALPVYTKTRQELEEIAEMAKVDTSKTAEEKKRAREEEEEKAEIEATKAKKAKKQKKQLAAKSPLVKALKNTHKKTEENVEVTTETPSKKKKKKRSNSTEEKDGIEAMQTPKSSRKKSTAKDETSIEKETPKSSKKKKTVSSDKTFVSSKKFKGAKKGYVFRMGPKGLGYYTDVKPVVDKMAMAALARAGGQGKRQSTGRSRKSGRKGRR